MTAGAGEPGHWLALFRFWPDVAPGALAAARSPAYRERLHPLALTGAFDLAIVLRARDIAEAASAALGEAAALTGLGRSGAASARGPRRGTRPRDPLLPPPATFDDVPASIGVHLTRAMDGWNAFAIPGQPAWLSFCMAFLRRRLYMRVAYDDAWHSAEVNELAALVVGTHRAEDVEGTTFTYQVPCIAVPGWLDEEQAEADGLASLEGTESSLLASALQYGALLRDDGGMAGALSRGGLKEYVARRLRAEAGGDVTLSPD